MPHHSHVFWLQAAPALTMSSSASQEGTESSKASHYAAALGGIFAGIFGASCMASANEVADGLHSPHFHWPHAGMLDSYDHGSIRRGHQVGAGDGAVTRGAPRATRPRRYQRASWASWACKDALCFLAQWPGVRGHHLQLQLQLQVQVHSARGLQAPPPCCVGRCCAGDGWMALACVACALHRLACAGPCCKLLLSPAPPLPCPVHRCTSRCALRATA